jgi:hypothetical protein
MTNLYKTYNGAQVSVMRDANANELGYDGSPGSCQFLICVSTMSATGADHELKLIPSNH